MLAMPGYAMIAGVGDGGHRKGAGGGAPGKGRGRRKCKGGRRGQQGRGGQGTHQDGGCSAATAGGDRVDVANLKVRCLRWSKKDH